MFVYYIYFLLFSKRLSVFLIYWFVVNDFFNNFGIIWEILCFVYLSVWRVFSVLLSLVDEFFFLLKCFVFENKLINVFGMIFVSFFFKFKIIWCVVFFLTFGNFIKNFLFLCLIVWMICFVWLEVKIVRVFFGLMLDMFNNFVNNKCFLCVLNL